MIVRTLALAIRNLGRNRRRALVSALAIAFGAMAIVLLQSFVNGFVRDRIEASALARHGAIQIHKKGYFGSNEPLRASIRQDPAFVARLRAVPGVIAVAPRLDFDGMVSNGSESTMFVATAIDPETEYGVCPKRASNIVGGTPPLGAGDRSGALLGAALAEALHAARGGVLVMQAAGPKASPNALDVSVLGFLPSQHVTESKRLATVTLDLAQELLRMKDAVTGYVIRVDDLERVDDVAGRVRAKLGTAYEVTTWKDIDPGTRDRTRVLRFLLAFVMVVLFVLVATGIVNTMVMSVYERVREIGTMLAIGVRRRQVLALFLWEATSLALASAAIGTAAGWSLVQLASRKGIVVHQPGGDAMTVYPSVDARFIALVIAFAVMGTALAALQPAWKASRLHPVEALRAT